MPIRPAICKAAAAAVSSRRRPSPFPASGPPGWQLLAQTSWFALPVLGGRHLTVEIAAIDQAGLPAQNKLRPLLGAGNGSLIPPDPPTNATTAPFNAVAGNTALGIDAIADGELLLAVADQRGDGRPDYTYRGRLLYAANVTPPRICRLPAATSALTAAASVLAWS